MTDGQTLSWSTVDPGHTGPGELLLDELAALAQRCLDVDGGMPLAADPGFLRRRYLDDTATRTTVRRADGGLVAVCAVRIEVGEGPGRGAVVTALVDPDVRGRGIGPALLDAGLTEASARVAASAAASGDAETGDAETDGAAETESAATGPPAEAAKAGPGAAAGHASTARGRISVETESLTPAVAELFASRGLRQVFAEDVMRCDLTAMPDAGPVWPAGTTLSDWSDTTSARFHAVYAASFADRPRFPGWSAQEWIAWSVDEDFRPGWSVLASVPEIGDAGFVTCADGWLVQVGVVPAARGRGLGAALVIEALRRMRADGAAAVMLDVNVDNPAGDLYRRLGFTVLGRRARFEPSEQPGDRGEIRPL